MRWPWRRPDAVIDTLIVPPVVKYRGHDEALERRTRKRRQQAELLLKNARRIATQDDGRAKLHLIAK